MEIPIDFVIQSSITLHRLDGRQIIVEATTAWPFASVTSAAKHLNAAVRREIERTRVSFSPIGTSSAIS